MKKWQKKVILLIAGLLFAFFTIRTNKDRILEIYSPPSLDYNAQRIFQLETMIAPCSSNYENGSVLQKNIDVHG